MTDRSITTVRRVRRPWWVLSGVLGILATLAATVLGAVGAAAAEEASASVRVDKVDATGDTAVISGVLVGASPESLEVRSGDAVLDATVIPVDAPRVVAVIDNAELIGNGPVQLAKQSVAPLIPPEGAAGALGVVSTGGGATVETVLTTSPARVQDALGEIAPLGRSATWQGLLRAAEILEDGGGSQDATVVLITSTAPADSVTPSAARSALDAAGARLEVVALPYGAPVDHLSSMVADLGGSIRVVASDDELAAAVDSVASGLSNRFALSVPITEDSGLVPLTLMSGEAGTEIAYTVGQVRSGASQLAPVEPGGGGIFANPAIKWVVVLLGLIAGFMLAWSLGVTLIPDGDGLGARLEVYDENFGLEMNVPADSTPEEGRTSIPIIARAVELTGEIAQRRGVLEKVEIMLERANLPLRAAEAMFFSAALAGLLVVASFLLSGNILVALGVAVLAVLIPPALLNHRISARRRAFEQQLPDMLTLLAGTLRAGYSISQGIEAMSKEIDEPMAREMRRVVSETRLGRPLEESLEAVAERMESEDFAWAVMAIRIQREVGGNLAELLLTVADTMVQRERLRREVKTLTAEGRISAIIIGALPPGVGALIFVMNREYIQPLFTEPLGLTLLGVAAVSMLIGFAWMKKCITIEV